MAIVKLTKSGKAISFIDEEGNVFVTSKIAMINMLNGTLNGNFVLLSRLPFKIDQNRFKPSPVYIPPGYIAPKDDDALSHESRKANEQKKVYSDADVKW